MRLIMIAMAILSMSTSFAHNLGSPLKFAPNLKGSIETKDYHQTIEHLSHLGIEIAGVDYKNKIIDVLISDSEYKILLSEGIEVELNWVKGLWSDSFLDDEYKSPSEVEEFVQKFHELYPELTQLVSIGKSLEGRDIWALKISDNADSRELNEPTILFNSMHHAREVMTPEVSMDIIEYLLTKYGHDSEATHWVNSNEIWVVPMFNVDGNNKVWNGNTMWRKNARGGYGVDLNRNYPFNWNACNGSSGSTRSQTYRGPEAGSEPETKALMGLVRMIKPVFDISYHSYSELVLYPYGCKTDRTAKTEVLETIGQELGRTLGYTAGTPWEILYSADGGDIDWMYGDQQVIPFVIELNSRSEGFQPNYNKTRDRTVKLNRKGWQQLLNRLEESGVRGIIASKSSDNEDVIEVYKKDKTLYQTYNVNPDGTFHIVLQPGEYILEMRGNTSFQTNVLIEDKLVNLGTL